MSNGDSEYNLSVDFCFYDHDELDEFLKLLSSWNSGKSVNKHFVVSTPLSNEDLLYKNVTFEKMNANMNAPNKSLFSDDSENIKIENNLIHASNVDNSRLCLEIE